MNLDHFILGDSNGAWTDDHEDATDAWLDREAEEARGSDDPAAMVVWLEANMPRHSPVTRIWRAEVARRNTLTIGV